MRVAVIHNAVEASDGPDARDVLVQVEAVVKALRSLGCQTATIACTLNLDRLQRTLKAACADVAFNLVESLAGTGRLIHLTPAVLDALRVPYTGSSAESILMTSNKVMAKHHMSGRRLPVPEWIGPCSDKGRWPESLGEDFVRENVWIIKSVWEHASIGLDETCLVEGKNPGEITDLLRLRSGSFGGTCFAERFIDGREFNLSLLCGRGGPVVLPPAEIVFERYQDGRPRIVDYQAKWNESSFAFNHTPRRFDFGREDAALLENLKGLATRCWEEFGLRGYARVDFRVDPEGRPWILEVNTNPCLSPDAGMAAALTQGGVAFEEAIRRILDDVL